MEKNKILGIILILLIIPLFYFGYQVYLGELQFKTVLSGSMSPAINAGDVILISKTNPREIKEGDIITFREGNTFITHRVIEIINNSFRTKGDANEDPDMKIIKTEQVVGKVIFVIPFLGYLGYFVRTLPGFLLFILIPGILIIYSEIKKIKLVIKAKPKYEIDKMEKEEILSKIRRELSSYNHTIKRNLFVYLICASLLIFLISPYYTGAFFKDVELSAGNIIQAGVWGGGEQKWDVSARFDIAHCNDFYPFSSTPGEIGKTYYAKLDGSSDDLYTEVHGVECCLEGNCRNHWGNSYVNSTRMGPWVVERKYVDENTYRILIRGASKADCSCGGNGYVKGEVVINPDSSWKITEIIKNSVNNDNRGRPVYCDIDKDTGVIKFAGGSTCGSPWGIDCCCCIDSGQIDIEVIVSKTTNNIVCGDGTCNGSETFETCPEDCGYEINPYDADVDTCTSSSGKVYPTTGNNSASWFVWNGCAHNKYYRVNKGEKLIFKVHTDSCSDCVCYHPNFYVYEYENGNWVQKKYFDLPDEKGKTWYEDYTPTSNRIKIYAPQCFYLDVYSLTEPDTTNPSIFYNPSTTQEGNQTEKWIFINVTASDNIGNYTVKLYWNGNEEDFENKDGDIYWTNKTNLTDGNYSFYALIEDKAGNTNQTEEREVKIYTENSNGGGGSGSGSSGGSSGKDNNNNTENTITFSINLTSPENNSYTNKNTTEFNFTVSGTEQNYTCELFLKNQSGSWINYGINESVKNNTLTTIIPNQSFENLSEGIYNWVINCTANQITNSSETRVFTIDRTAPIVNLLNSSFITNEAQPKIYFNFIDDLSDKANCILYFNNSEVGNNNSATENTTTFIIPDSAQDDGNYTVYVNCTDLAGNTNKSQEINVSIDAPPTTTATGIKEDGTNYTFGEWTNSSYINVTLNCSATDCNTTLYCTDANNSCEPNLTYNGTQIQISAEGITYLRFRSNDTAGNNESVKNESIKIDRTIPLIQINSPISNSTSNINLIEINLTIIEDNLNYTNISVYNSTGDLVNSTIDNRTGNYTINLSVPDGIYNITAISFDLAGNKNSTTVENITVDTTPPEIQFTAPTTQTGNYSRNYIEANLTVLDKNIENVTIYLYNSTGLLYNFTNSTGFFHNFINLNDGVYYLNATANDTFGNTNKTETMTIRLDTTPPKISDWNINNTSVPVNSSVKLNAIITDFIGVDTVKFFIEPFGNLTVNKNGNEYFIICNSTNPCNTTQAGVYNWTKIWANDTLGNSIFSNISLQFNITN